MLKSLQNQYTSSPYFEYLILQKYAISQMRILQEFRQIGLNELEYCATEWFGPKEQRRIILFSNARILCYCYEIP